jgi:excisionase family DNA binding protein
LCCVGEYWLKSIKYSQKPVPNLANDQVLTLEELGVYLKIPKSTLYKLVQEGRVPGQKLGKQWRFGKAAIDRWLDSELPPQKGGAD